MATFLGTKRRSRNASVETAPAMQGGRDGFCWQCTLGLSYESPIANDFSGLCGRSDNILVHCAGCRADVWVDHRGRRVGALSRPVGSVRRIDAPPLVPSRL